jgi:hypothetical protein
MLPSPWQVCLLVLSVISGFQEFELAFDGIPICERKSCKIGLCTVLLTANPVK